jgi:GTP cyclohydrolase II
MTNNPLKIAALKSAGLEVVADERILGRKTDQNVHYLATKRDRAGHMIDLDQLSTQGLVGD